MNNNLVAIVAVKDEELFIENCIKNLVSQGFDIYLIDNESTDRTVEIAKRYLNKGVLKIESLKTGGVLELKTILNLKEEIANSMDADWFMHSDADEIRLPHSPFKTIKQALKKVETLGYNAVNFNVFNFMPEKGKSYVGRDYEKEMKYYYYYSSEPFSQIKLWKKTGPRVSFGTSGGHKLYFDGIRIYPNPFIIKHYMFLSEEHGIEKYSKKRKYSEHAVKNLGWHGFRGNFKEENFYLPPKSKLKKLENNHFDTSEPTPVHLFYKMTGGIATPDEQAVKSKPKPAREPQTVVVTKTANDRRTAVKIYRLFLSIYRRVIPFRVRQKVKNTLINSSNY